MPTTNPFLPLSDADRQAMLAEVGYPSFEAMVGHIPADVRLPSLDLQAGLSELEVQTKMRALADRNTPLNARSFLGAGVYQRFIPAAVDALLSRAEFYTAYTPYQPEISQGTLQYTYEYQSLVCALTGMDVSNASMYDASTATAEAAFMAMRITGRHKVLLAGSLHPEYVEVMHTYAKGPDCAVAALPVVGQLTASQVQAALSDEVACVVVQSPNFFGQLEDLQAIADVVHAAGALLVAVVNPVSLAVLAPPGDCGVDIAVGDGQSVGNMPNFGGPHVGFLACHTAHFRQLPGRIVGATVDADGERAYTLTLQTREQHIRREKATSNICTNQALCALAVTTYLSLAGPEGLREVAEVSASRAHALAVRIAELPGFSLAFDGPFLDEFAVRSPVPVERLLADLNARGIMGGVALGPFFRDLADTFLVAVTEVNDPASLDALVLGLREASRSTAAIV